MRRNKKNVVDEGKLIKEILSKRNCIIFFLLDDKVSDMYERNLETFMHDDDNVFLKAMINYLSETKMLTHDMRNRGYDILSLLFFNRDFINKERTELINKIKELLNLMPIVDDYVFMKSEYDKFYDVTKLDYSEALEFNRENLLRMENQVNDFIYCLSCMSDDEYYNKDNLDSDTIYYINYILNNCKETFQISVFRNRTFEILKFIKLFLKTNKNKVADYNENVIASKKIIRKAKKV